MSRAPDGTDRAAWLADVALDTTGTWDSPWLQASVLRALPSASADHAHRVAEELSRRTGLDPVLAETAAWARA